MKSLAHLQSLVVTRSSLLDQGYTSYWLRKALIENRARSLRRGAYIQTEQWKLLDPWERYAVETFAYHASATNPVFSHETAALHLGLWLIHEPPQKIHVYNNPHTRGTTRGVLRHTWRGEDLPKVFSENGIWTTTVSQTVLDCARTLSLPRALCIADSALHRGLVSVPSCLKTCWTSKAKGRGECDVYRS